MTQFAKGTSPRLYKKVLHIFGQRNVDLLKEVYALVRNIKKNGKA